MHISAPYNWENRSWYDAMRCDVMWYMCVRAVRVHVCARIFSRSSRFVCWSKRSCTSTKPRRLQEKRRAAIIQLLQSSQVCWTCKSWLDWCTCFHFPTDKMRSRQCLCVFLLVRCCRCHCGRCWCSSIAKPCSISSRIHNNHFDCIFFLFARQKRHGTHIHSTLTRPNLSAHL